MSHPIPQPKGLPLVGNVLDVKPSNTWQSLQRLAERYGEIFQIKVLGNTIVFVAGAALAEEICDEKRFRKYVGGPIVEIRHAVHDALFSAFDYEENWGIAHRIVAPRLAPGAVKEWCGEVVGCTSELIGKWKGLKESDGGAVYGRGVDLMDELNRLNLEATTLTMFGKKLNCINAAESHPMLQGMEDSTAEAMQRPTRPGLFNWLFYGGKFKKSIKAMREDYASDLVSYRKQNPTGRRDILSALMEGKDDQTGKGLTEEQVVDEIVSMPIGSSTAPCMIGSEIYYLLKNKECIKRARQELDRVVGPWSRTGGATTQIRAEHLPQLEYIEGIVRESLRLSFAAPGFNIEPVPRPHGPSGDPDKTPVLLANGKYQIAHDQPMIIVLAGVNRDPAVFDEPLAFRPERMMGQAFEDLPRGVKKWFGNGKRECIGKHWAWQFNMVVTAMLIRECDFEMVDPDWKLDGHQDGWFNYRPVGFKARVKSRAL